MIPRFLFVQIEVSTELGVGEWNEVTLRNIGEGTGALQVLVNGVNSDHTTVSGRDTLLNLELLDGPLYIGGHPNILEVQVHMYKIMIVCVCPLQQCCLTFERLPPKCCL